MDIGLGLAIAGIVIAIAIWRHQDRTPLVDVTCELLEDGSPRKILCRLHNRGRAEARHVRVGFNRMLPLETRVLAAPEVGARLDSADAPPDPGVTPLASEYQTAFSVSVPRVAPGDTIELVIETNDPDNVRAAEQLQRIQREMFDALQAFGRCLRELYGAEPHGWDYDTLVVAHQKQESFFLPGKVSYERGRHSISWITEEESLSFAIHQDYYSRHKAECMSAFTNRPEFKAPVVRIHASQGETTYAVMPAYVKTFIEAVVSRSDLKKGIFVRPPVPTSYD